MVILARFPVNTWETENTENMFNFLSFFFIFVNMKFKYKIKGCWHVAVNTFFAEFKLYKENIFSFFLLI